MKRTIVATLTIAALALALMGCGAQAAPNANAPAGEEIYLAPKLDSPSATLAANQAVLTPEEAKALAFAHAGVTEAFDLEIELDAERGVWHYDVDFDTTEAEFDYEVEAYTGEILKSKKEPRKAVSQPAAPETQPEATAKLTREEAKSIALKHAGVSKAYDLDVELDKEKGVWIYEVDFEAAGVEYEYDIDAATGEILRSRKELDD